MKKIDKYISDIDEIINDYKERLKKTDEFINSLKEKQKKKYINHNIIPKAFNKEVIKKHNIIFIIDQLEEVKKFIKVTDEKF